ncbi:MAG: zinc-ribbon domain-containing protein, partial [Candidatus Kariarchaeaceae archaeon]
IQKGSKQLSGKIESWPHLIAMCIKSIDDNHLKRDLTEQYQKKLYYNRKREWKQYGLRFNRNNQLKTKRPDLVKELHPSLNYDKLPLKMHFESDTQLWWICDLKHKYKMALSARTIENEDCPICSYRDIETNREHKPKYFWQTIDPGYNYAIKVLIDFFIENERVPAASESKIINRIYKAILNDKVKKIWGVDNWSELLRITIGNLGYEMGDLRDRLIKSYNSIAINQKHNDWVLIIVE